MRAVSTEPPSTSSDLAEPEDARPNQLHHLVQRVRELKQEKTALLILLWWLFIATNMKGVILRKYHLAIMVKRKKYIFYLLCLDCNKVGLCYIYHNEYLWAWLTHRTSCPRSIRRSASWLLSMTDRRIVICEEVALRKLTIWFVFLSQTLLDLDIEDGLMEDLFSLPVHKELRKQLEKAQASIQVNFLVKTKWQQKSFVFFWHFAPVVIRWPIHFV